MLTSDQIPQGLGSRLPLKDRVVIECRIEKSVAWNNRSHLFTTRRCFDCLLLQELLRGQWKARYETLLAGVDTSRLSLCL